MKGNLGRRLAAAIITTVVLGVLVNPSARADDRQEAVRLLNEARLMFESMTADPNFSALRNLLKKADGVFLVPQMLKGAFVVAVRESLNRAFYGKKLSPTDILVRGTAVNPLAEPLVTAAAKAAGK